MDVVLVKERLKKIAILLVLVVLLVATILLKGLWDSNKQKSLVKNTEELTQVFVQKLGGTEVSLDSVNSPIKDKYIKQLEDSLHDYYAEEDYKVYLDEAIKEHMENIASAVEGTPAVDSDVNVADFGEDEYMYVGEDEEGAVEEYQDTLWEYTLREEDIKTDEKGKYVYYSELEFIEGSAFFEYGGEQISLLRSDYKYLKEELPNLEGFQFIKLDSSLSDTMLTNSYKSSIYIMHFKWSLDGNKITDLDIELSQY